MNTYEAYKAAVAEINEELDPELLLLMSIFLGSVLILLVGLYYDIFLGTLLAAAIIDIVLGYPLYRSQTRVEEMERRLPDVLMHIATSLKAGGTVESALSEVAGGRYGVLAKEMRKMLIRMKEGKTFDEAFEDFAKATGSDIIERTAMVIISARRSGGGMADALMSIAEDVRDIYKIKAERRAKTTTYILFILIAGILIAPLIFGIVSGLMRFLGSIAGSSAAPLFDSMIFYFKLYLAVSAIFTSLAASMVREGNLSRSALYAPFFLLIAYITFQVVSTFALQFFGIG